MVGKLGPVWPMSLIAYSTKSYKHNDSHRNHQHYIIHQATKKLIVYLYLPSPCLGECAPKCVKEFSFWEPLEQLRHAKMCIELL